MKFTRNQISAFVRSSSWTGTEPMFNDFDRNWGNAETLKEGFVNFKKERNRMFNSIKAEFQSSHSAMSKSGVDAYANNWN
jgi:hypothetical protein